MSILCLNDVSATSVKEISELSSKSIFYSLLLSIWASAVEETITVILGVQDGAGLRRAHSAPPPDVGKHP